MSGWSAARWPRSPSWRPTDGSRPSPGAEGWEPRSSQPNLTGVNQKAFGGRPDVPHRGGSGSAAFPN